MKKYTIISILGLSTAFTLTASAQETAAFDTLLKKYAAADGVHYDKWAASAADKKALDTILKDWAKIDATKLPQNEKAAFRINLYNAAMIDVALDHYPLESVTKIGDKDFAVFDKPMIVTPNGTISLNTLEKKQLIADFPDARIHFAVNCASESCPPLRNEAFVADKLEAQLQEQAVLFANSTRAAQGTAEGGAIYSELFNWYSKDFGTKNPAEYLNKFRTAKIDPNTKQGWIKYDWSLNAAK